MARPLARQAQGFAKLAAAAGTDGRATSGAHGANQPTSRAARGQNDARLHVLGLLIAIELLGSLLCTLLCPDQAGTHSKCNDQW